MSKHSEAANEVAKMVLVQGNLNGQRWVVNQAELVACLEAHYAAPEPVAVIEPAPEPVKPKGKGKQAADG